MRWGGAEAPTRAQPPSKTRATGTGSRSPAKGPKGWKLRSGEHTMPLRCVALSHRPRGVSRHPRNQVPPLRHPQHLQADRARTRAPRASRSWRRTLWLYIPLKSLSPSDQSEASLCAQELEAWSSASMLQNPNTALSVTSSGTVTPRPFSWRGWKTRPYVTRLYGTILPPSTAHLGVERWISSVRDIRANPSRQPAGSARSKTHGISGLMSRGLSRNASRTPSSLRTSAVMSIGDFARSPVSYAAWATASKRACSQRLRSALLTGGSAYSYWPTPTASLMANRAELRVSETGSLWVPAADQVGNQVSIGEAAKNWTVFRRMAVALGWQAGPTPSFPFSRRVLATIRPGSGSSPGEWTLNPAFMEWLMGWPIGWSDITRPVTGFAPWLRRSRGALSMLASNVD